MIKKILPLSALAGRFIGIGSNQNHHYLFKNVENVWIQPDVAVLFN